MRVPHKLGISLGTLFLAGTAGEVSLRFVDYNPLGEFREGAWRDLVVRPSANRSLVYEPTPLARGEGWGAEISINSRGFRDREYPLERQPGLPRIAVLGDSITFGNRMHVEQTYPEVLERTLAEAGQPCEVLNLGVGGYDSVQEAAFLEQVGLPFEPDLAVVGYCFNDLGTASINLAYLENVERYSSWIYRARLAQFLTLWLDRRGLASDFHNANLDDAYQRRYESSIADLAKDEQILATMARLGELLPRDPDELREHPILPWYTSRPHVGRLRYAFGKLARIGRERELEILVLVLPYLGEGEIANAYDLAYAIVGYEARRAGLQVLDIRKTIRALRPRELRLDPLDPIHYDARGHEAIACELAEHLIGSGRLQAWREEWALDDRAK